MIITINFLVNGVFLAKHNFTNEKLPSYCIWCLLGCVTEAGVYGSPKLGALWSCRGKLGQ